MTSQGRQGKSEVSWVTWGKGATPEEKNDVDKWRASGEEVKAFSEVLCSDK